MKKPIATLVTKTLRFLTLWAVVAVTLCQVLPMHFFNAEYPMWLRKMETVADPGTHTNFVIGDSRAIAALEAERLGPSFYNLALGGGTPMEGYYMLRSLLEAGHTVDTLIVSYAPIHFEQSEMFWDRQLKYRFYDMDEVREIFGELNVEGERFWSYDDRTPIRESERPGLLWRARLTTWRSPSELRAELSKSLCLRGYSNYGVYRAIEARKGSFDFGRAKASHGLNVEAKRTEFLPRPILVRSLERTFDLAAANGIHTVFVPVPMNRTSFEALTPEYKDGVETLWTGLADRFPKVRFTDTRIGYLDDGFFGDPSHVNIAGRNQFMSRLLTQDPFFSEGRDRTTGLSELQY